MFVSRVGWVPGLAWFPPLPDEHVRICRDPQSREFPLHHYSGLGTQTRRNLYFFALFSINSFNFDSSMEFAPPSMRGDGVHGMQHMKPIGTPGRPPPNHQGQGHGSNTMLADAGYGPPGGGILKKPCPYGSQMEVPSLDKDKWLEENADRLSRLERLDRLSMSSQNQLNVQQVCIF